MNRFGRWYPAAVTLLLAAMAIIMFHAAALESQTYDEGFHITAGYSYWKTGDYRLNPEHPPLVKLLCAIPLLIARADFPMLKDAWESADQTTYFGYFVYRNRIDADRLLLLARSVTILLTLTLGLAIATYARRRYSALAALVALGFFVTDANFIAHGHYVTTDVPVALFIFLAAITWLKALDSARWRDYGLAGLLLGLAFGAKFSAVFLVPAHLITALWKRRFPFGRFALAGVTALAVVGLLYLPETRRTGQMEPLAAKIPRDNPLANAAHVLAAALHLPAHRFLTGLWSVAAHNREGHPSYLNGKINHSGDWRYFPTAFAVKTPTPVAVLSLPAIILGAPGVWLVYPALYGALSLGANLNIGLRHLLPVYPFLFVSIGALFARWLPSRLAVAALVAAALVQVAELARVEPHYLAFFNTIAGGPANGHKYLLDSNLDWGQDAKNLGRWMRAHNLNQMCVSYFGTASLDYYGINQIPLLALPAGTDPRSLNCAAAISANNLYDLYTPAGQHAWARALTPIGNIGYSIYLYDLRPGRRPPRQ